MVNGIAGACERELKRFGERRVIFGDEYPHRCFPLLARPACCCSSIVQRGGGDPLRVPILCRFRIL
jgi:hypothetical protein